LAIDETSTVAVPQHVVFREFPAETVVLDLRTGRYYGLNRTAARILEALSADGAVAGAIDRVARGYGRPREEIAGAVITLCESLRERGLIDVEGGG
jgi:hypothetical protein